MGDPDVDDEEATLPTWGASARRTTRRAWRLFVVFWMAGLVVQGLDLVFGADNHDLRQALLHDLPWAVVGWPLVVGYFGSLAVVLLAGTAWLISAVFAGYREPKSDV